MAAVSFRCGAEIDSYVSSSRRRCLLEQSVRVNDVKLAIGVVSLRSLTREHVISVVGLCRAFRGRHDFGVSRRRYTMHEMIAVFLLEG